MATAVQDVSLSSAASPPAWRTRPSEAWLYSLWGLFCALMVVVALRDYYHEGGSQLWQPLLWEGSSLAFATGLLVLERTLGSRYTALLDSPLRWFGHHLKWLPLINLAFVLAVYGARHAVYRLLGETYEHESWALVIPYESIKLSLFVGLWLGVVFSFDSFSRWQGQQQRLLELQRALSESQLSQLSAQLRPHFFFNALNTISALMHLDVARADRLLARLGDLLRASLSPAGQSLVPLREELRLLELYGQVMLERFADRVSIDWQIDECTQGAPVPALLLQPLLENAFKYAVERGRSQVAITVSASREAEYLVLRLRNTGSTLPRDFREGVGLRNCRERLQCLYGDAASMSLSGSGEGVEAVVSLPWPEQAP